MAIYASYSTLQADRKAAKRARRATQTTPRDLPVEPSQAGHLRHVARDNPPLRYLGRLPVPLVTWYLFFFFFLFGLCQSYLLHYELIAAGPDIH
jgi:hypothetical protein